MTERQTPALAWVILAWQVFGALLSVLGVALGLSGVVPFTPEQQTYVDRALPFGPIVGIVVAGLGLWAAILLVKLRKQALWFFVAALVIQLAWKIYLGGSIPTPSMPIAFSVISKVLAYGIVLGIIAYVVRLYRKEVIV